MNQEGEEVVQHEPSQFFIPILYIASPVKRIGY